MEDSLKKRYSIKLAANIISGLINIIFLAIVPKALGPVAFGHFSYLQQFFSQIIAFIDGGTSTAFFTKLSAKNERKELISFYFIVSICLLIFLMIFFSIIDITGHATHLLPGIPTDYLYLGLWFGFFTWFVQVLIKIADAYALTVSVELIKISHKFVMLGLLLYLIQRPIFDLTGYFYFHYFSLLSFLLLITGLFFRKSVLSIELVTLKLAYNRLIKEFIKFSSSIFIFNIVAIGVSLFDIWLLQKTSGSIETGFYGLAYSIAAICFLFTSAMTPLITREFSKSYENSKMNEVRRLFKKYIPMLYAIAAYFGVFIALQSENVLLVFTDEQFKGAYVALIIMAFYPLHQTYGQLNSALFFATEKTQLYKKIGIVTSIVGLSFSLTFIYLLNLGAEGFAWKMVLVQVISVNAQLYFNTKLLKLKLLPFIKHQLYCLLILGLLAYIGISITPADEPLLNLFISGVIYTVLVIMATFFFPSLFMTKREVLKQFGYKLIRKRQSRN
jgi:O-antigen/teichoic acid export membrane protein